MSDSNFKDLEVKDPSNINIGQEHIDKRIKEMRKRNEKWKKENQDLLKEKEKQCQYLVNHTISSKF